MGRRTVSVFVLEGASREPRYRIGNRFARVAFAPISVTDQKLRPDYWVRITDLTRWQTDIPTEEASPTETNDALDKIFGSIVPVTFNAEMNEDGEERAADMTSFLQTKVAELQAGPKKLESFRDAFVSVTGVTPPEEWCYSLALSAFLSRDPKPELSSDFDFSPLSGRPLNRNAWN